MKSPEQSTINPEEVSVIVNQSLIKTLKPFKVLGRIDQGLPSLTLLELSRRSGLSPETVEKNLPEHINLGQQDFLVKLKKPNRLPIKKLIKNSVRERPIKGQSGITSFDSKRFRRKKKQALIDKKQIIFKRTDWEQHLKAKEHACREAIKRKQAKKWGVKLEKLENTPITLDILNHLSDDLTESKDIQKCNWKNLCNLEPKLRFGSTLRVSAVFCPLYIKNTSLSESGLQPITETDLSNEQLIIDSRVGQKWMTTKLVLEKLSDILKSDRIKIHFKVFFSDVGVFVTDLDPKNPHLLSQHQTLYNNCLESFCQKKGFSLTFKNLSELPLVDNTRQTPMFTRANAGQNANHLKKLNSILSITGLFPDQLKPNKAKLLIKLFEICGHNPVIFRDLINTYTNYHPSTDSDLFINIERFDGLLALQTALKSSHVATIPHLNILV